MNTDDVIRSLVCLFAIDGAISQPEMTFLRDTATRLGVAPDVVKATLDVARQGQGKIYLSNNPAELRQIFDILVQASVADGRLDPQERKLLNLIAVKIKLSGLDLEALLNRKLQTAQAAQPPSSPSGQAPGMTCPKCGFDQKAGRTECIRCGIIFQRITAPAAPGPQPQRTLKPDMLTVHTNGFDLPHIWLDGNVLHLETGILRKITTFGSYCRRVVVDRQARAIRVTTRYLWVFSSSKTMAFDQIRSIETGYHADTHHYRRRGFHLNQYSEHETNIRYTILLFLERPYERYELFHFTSVIAYRAKAAFEEYFELLKAFTSV